MGWGGPRWLPPPAPVAALDLSSPVPCPARAGVVGSAGERVPWCVFGRALPPLREGQTPGVSPPSGGVCGFSLLGVCGCASPRWDGRAPPAQRVPSSTVCVRITQPPPGPPPFMAAAAQGLPSPSPRLGWGWRQRRSPALPPGDLPASPFLGLLLYVCALNLFCALSIKSWGGGVPQSTAGLASHRFGSCPAPPPQGAQGETHGGGRLGAAPGCCLPPSLGSKRRLAFCREKGQFLASNLPAFPGGDASLRPVVPNARVTAWSAPGAEPEPELGRGTHTHTHTPLAPEPGRSKQGAARLPGRGAGSGGSAQRWGWSRDTGCPSPLLRPRCLPVPRQERGSPAPCLGFPPAWQAVGGGE